MPELDQRLDQLTVWLQSLPELTTFTLAPASADASFRRYFRVTTPSGSYVAMDAPPTQEDCRPFSRITGLLEKQGLHVPHIHAHNLDAGFLLLDDLGNRHYLAALDTATVEHLYDSALTALAQLQETSTAIVPLYDEALLQTEMALFEDWFLQAHLQITLAAPQQLIWNKLRQTLVENALNQPQVFVHRDYHSRNLMVTTENNPGIIDYQDAVRGPLTYDLVSLLKDCYIDWPDRLVTDFVLRFRALLQDRGLASEVESDTFERWFDLMGMQRHLKAIGIFARLNHRDGKSGYLDDIPRTLNYIVQTTRKYPETREFGDLTEALGLSARVEP